MQIATTAEVETRPDSGHDMSGLARLASAIALGIVDVAGFLDDIETMAKTQVAEVDTVARDARDVLTSNAKVFERLEHAGTASADMAAALDSAVSFVRSAGDRTRGVAQWVRSMSDTVEDLTGTLATARASNNDITQIAMQVNILAINAKIEAMRAGPEGRGFAVVAEAINELSQQTAKAASQITDSIETLTKALEALHQQSGEVRESADLVLTDAHKTDETLQALQQEARILTTDTSAMQKDAAQVQEATGRFVPACERLDQDARKSADGVSTTRKRVHALIDAAEGIVQKSIELGGALDDGPFVDRVMADAHAIGNLFEKATSSGDITEAKLFDQAYKPIPGTNPQQVMTDFTLLTDKLLPPIQEEALKLDPRVVFCAAVDVNGYLPTHNLKFSQPQGRDPIWNTANCRNRRIFDDRVGLKAGQHKAPFLLQTYRRDMGGGQFAMMKDVSAPIWVNGRHWGGLRLAYKV